MRERIEVGGGMSTPSVEARDISVAVGIGWCW